MAQSHESSTAGDEVDREVDRRVSQQANAPAPEPRISTCDDETWGAAHILMSMSCGSSWENYLQKVDGMYGAYAVHPSNINTDTSNKENVDLASDKSNEEVVVIDGVPDKRQRQ